MLSLPILTFHDLDDSGSVISFPPALFRRGLEALFADGFRALKLTQAADLVYREEPFPPKSFVITFDDGYRSFFTDAFPVINRLMAPATVFLTVSKGPGDHGRDALPPFNGRQMLVWDEIREANASGLVEFGAHTLTHPDLTAIDLALAEKEICESKSIIEDALGSEVQAFAYPFGRYNSATREIVSRYFRCACSDRLGLLRQGADTYTLERVDGYYLRSESLFNLMKTSFFPWYILARRIPRRIRRVISKPADR